jgi:hypothetical protein
MKWLTVALKLYENPKLTWKLNDHFSVVHSNKLLSHSQSLTDLIYKFSLLRKLQTLLKSVLLRFSDKNFVNFI